MHDQPAPDRLVYYRNVDLGSATLEPVITEAIGYIRSRSWCQRIIRVFLALEHADKLVVLLVEIAPAREGIPVWHWVVAGDVPTVYLPGPECDHEHDAINVFLGTLQDWVDAVRAGGDLSKAFPIDAAPTPENADALERRIQYIAKTILNRG